MAEANAYQPTKWVVVAPDGLTLTRAAKGKVNVRGDAVRMSVHGLDQRWPNLALELVNTALEAVVDLASPGLHPLAKVAKDAAAGAVLIASAGALVVGLVLLLPPLWKALGGE